MIHLVHQSVQQLICNYGSIALFSLLAFGIIGLPVPDETLLLLSGVMAAKGYLSIFTVMLAAACGSCIGITVSYILGRSLGHKFVMVFGKYFGLSQSKLKKAHDWFAKMGKYLLFIGYFIPGVRHLTGIVAGTTELEYRYFAPFAYAGAIIWSILFVFLGFFFFNQWNHWYL